MVLSMIVCDVHDALDAATRRTHRNQHIEEEKTGDCVVKKGEKPGHCGVGG